MNSSQWFGGSFRRDLTSNQTLKPRAASLQAYNATGATRTLTLESAKLYKPGPRLVTVANEGDQFIVIRDFTGSIVVSIASGLAATLSLISNQTDAGEWAAQTRTVGAESNVAYNLVFWMMDDTGRSQMPMYDDLNRWPDQHSGDPYPYPSMLFLTSKAGTVGDADGGVRFTQARVNPKCAPTRASIFTGRQSHRTTAHPWGHGIGDVRVEQPLDQVPFYEGITAAQRPWPGVAFEKGAPHGTAMFGKHHCYKFIPSPPNPIPGDALSRRVNPKAIVDALGFDEGHEILRLGAGAPGYGFFNWPYTITLRDEDAGTQYEVQYAGVGPSASGLPLPDDWTQIPNGPLGTNPWSPMFLFQKVTNYIKQCVDAGKPFVVDWEMNLVHDLLPAIEPVQILVDPFNPAGVPTTMYTCYDYEGLIPDAAAGNGETTTGGYDASGTPFGGSYQYVQSIASDSPALVTTYVAHNLSSGDPVLLDGVEAATDGIPDIVNGTTMYAGNITPTTFRLYYDVELSSAVNLNFLGAHVAGTGINRLAEPYLSNPYGTEGQVHLEWRRTRACLEAVDKLAEKVDEFIRVNYPDEYAKTVFMHYSDNGALTRALDPKTTAEFNDPAAPAGDPYESCIPPTTSGAITDPEDLDEQYHRSDDAKQSSKDEGTLTPLIVWGTPLGTARGQDCARTIDATDFYPTFLDILAPAWRDSTDAGDLAEIDGLSFYESIFDPTISEGKTYTSVGVFAPAYIDSSRVTLTRYDFALIGTSSSPQAAGYKLRRSYFGTTEDYELFNLSVDPAELVNLYVTGGPADVAARDELLVAHQAFFGQPQI